jgi:hypothetical protein
MHRIYLEVIEQYFGISHLHDKGNKARFTTMIKNTIDKPIVYNKQRADILAQFAAISLLLYRAFAFIVKISMLFANYRSSKDPAIAIKLQPHYVPKSILSLIQRERLFFSLPCLPVFQIQSWLNVGLLSIDDFFNIFLIFLIRESPFFVNILLKMLLTLRHVEIFE